MRWNIHYRKILVMVFSIFFIISTSKIAYASNASNEAIQAYYTCMQQGNLKSDSKSYEYDYFLLDMNNDGIKELIAQNLHNDVWICTYKNRKVIVLMHEKFISQVRISRSSNKKNIMIDYSTGSGLAENDIFHYNGKKLTRKTYTFGYSSEQKYMYGQPDLFYCNQRKISKKKYEKAVTSYKQANMKKLIPTLFSE